MKEIPWVWIRLSLLTVNWIKKVILSSDVTCSHAKDDGNSSIAVLILCQKRLINVLIRVDAHKSPEWGRYSYDYVDVCRAD